METYTQKIKKMTMQILENTYLDGHSLKLKNGGAHMPSPSTLMKPINDKYYEKMPSFIIKNIIAKAIKDTDMIIIDKLVELGALNNKGVTPSQIANVAVLKNIIFKQLTNQERIDLMLLKYGHKGKIIHESIEQSLINELIIPPFNLNAEFSGNWLAFEKFFKENKVENFETELRVWNREKRHSGIIDFVGKLNGELVILDWKTNSKINMDLIAIQLFYYKLALENWGIKIDNLVVVWFKKDGNYEIKKVNNEMFKIYNQICISLLNINEFTNVIKK